MSARPGIAPFRRLVAQVIRQEPYRSASRVFWIVDNGSSHRGDRARARLQAEWPRLVLVHTPVHASWLNQIEIYFSIVRRQVLTPNDFASLTAVKDRLLHFQGHYAQAATPFQWTFTRRDLADLLAKLARTPAPPRRMNPVRYVTEIACQSTKPSGMVRTTQDGLYHERLSRLLPRWGLGRVRSGRPDARALPTCTSKPCHGGRRLDRLHRWGRMCP